MKNFSPCGNQVLVRFIPTEDKENKTKNGIVLLDDSKTTNMNGNEIKVDKILFQVIKVGEKVDLKESSFGIGDLVIFNDYDIKYLQDDDGNGYLLTKSESIMGTYETSNKPAVGWDLEKY